MSEENLKQLINEGYRYAFALTHHRAMAEDILQMAWLGVLKAKGPKEKSYLFRAIRNHYLNSNKRHMLVPMLSLEEMQENDMTGESSYDHIQVKMDNRDLEKAMERLRSIEREFIFLHYYSGFTAQEIADFTDQSRNTVLSIINRSCKKLRIELEQKEEVAL